MRDTITIGSTPCEEDCAQVGTPDYGFRARKECQAFIDQLRRQFGPEPNGARLSIQGNPHDFGTYYEVVCKFEDTMEAAADYAFRCEGEAATTWDDEARKALGMEQSTS